MNSLRLIRKLGPALIIAGTCAGASVALAQDQLPTIKIEASVVNKKIIGKSSIGAPTEEVTVTRQISYSDLDLKTSSGAEALKKRVKEAAGLACKQLDDLYPLEMSDAPNCIKQTVADAGHQVEAAITAAQTSARK